MNKKQREKARLKYARRRARALTDPIYRAKWLAKKRRQETRRRARIKANPIKYAAFRRKQRTYQKKNRDRYRATSRKRVDAKRRWLYAYLKQHPCVDCGETDTMVLEFDHVRGVKVEGVCTMVKSSSLERIQAEIAKCDVRCRNCHLRITMKRAGTVRWLICQ